jgi:hypothetical protein
MTRKAIDAYIAAALAWSTPEIRSSYTALDAARKAMTEALGYRRVHDDLGEFCNLHERDIPGYLHARPVSPMVNSKERIAAGEIYSFSGWSTPVAEKELARLLAAARTRSDELVAWFLMPAVDRFLAGSHVGYRGLDGESYYVALYNHREAVPFLRVEKCVGLFDRDLVMQPIMGEHEARTFFANLGKYAFVKARS